MKSTSTIAAFLSTLLTAATTPQSVASSSASSGPSAAIPTPAARLSTLGCLVAAGDATYLLPWGISLSSTDVLADLPLLPGSIDALLGTDLMSGDLAILSSTDGQMTEVAMSGALSLAPDFLAVYDLERDVWHPMSSLAIAGAVAVVLWADDGSTVVYANSGGHWIGVIAPDATDGPWDGAQHEQPGQSSLSGAESARHAAHADFQSAEVICKHGYYCKHETFEAIVVCIERTQCWCMNANGTKDSNAKVCDEREWGIPCGIGGGSQEGPADGPPC